MKNGRGSIYSGPPKDCKPDCTITIDENDAIQLLDGSLDAAKVTNYSIKIILIRI